MNAFIETCSVCQTEYVVLFTVLLRYARVSLQIIL
jgi:hypothetical protein